MCGPHRATLSFTTQQNYQKEKVKINKCQLTHDFNGLLVVEFLVPVEHPQEGEGGEEDQADAQEHVAGETGKVDALEETQTGENGNRVVHHLRQRQRSGTGAVKAVRSSARNITSAAAGFCFSTEEHGNRSGLQVWHQRE